MKDLEYAEQAAYDDALDLELPDQEDGMEDGQTHGWVIVNHEGKTLDRCSMWSTGPCAPSKGFVFRSYRGCHQLMPPAALIYKAMFRPGIGVTILSDGIEVTNPRGEIMTPVERRHAEPGTD